mmetsp:Transcript_11332/g.35808  ORF Transcript_11332/g.35808 Transcript_11332/m.35808 type:complete len:555 (-) Transcript_11332:720-2384(-)
MSASAALLSSLQAEVASLRASRRRGELETSIVASELEAIEEASRSVGPADSPGAAAAASAAGSAAVVATVAPSSFGVGAPGQLSPNPTDRAVPLATPAPIDAACGEGDMFDASPTHGGREPTPRSSSPPRPSFAESLVELQACMARSSLGTGGGSSPVVAVAMASADAGAKEARGFDGASDSDATRLSASSDEECRAADDCATDKPGAGCPVPVPVGAPAAEREGVAQEETVWTSAALTSPRETTRAVAPPAQLREIRATSSLQRQPQPQAPPALPPPQMVTPALPPMPPARPLQPAATASVAVRSRHLTSTAPRPPPPGRTLFAARAQAPPAPAAPHAAASASNATAAPSAAAASRSPGQLAIAGGVATRRAPSSAYATPHAASSHTASRLLAAGGDGAKARLPEATSAFEFTNVALPSHLSHDLAGAGPPAALPTGPQPSALHEPVASSAVSAPAPPPLELVRQFPLSPRPSASLQLRACDETPRPSASKRPAASPAATPTAAAAGDAASVAAWRNPSLARLSTPSPAAAQLGGRRRSLSSHCSRGKARHCR